MKLPQEVRATPVPGRSYRSTRQGMWGIASLRSDPLDFDHSSVMRGRDKDQSRSFLRKRGPGQDWRKERVLLL